MKNKISYIYSRILSESVFEEKTAKALVNIGFLYPENVWNNLINIFKTIRDIETIPDKFLLKLLSEISESFEPDRALNNFEKFITKVDSPEKYINIIKESEELLKTIIALFSGSQFLSDIAIKDENNIEYLLKENLNVPKRKEKLHNEIKRILSYTNRAEENYSIIRKFKNREYLRVGLRDLLRKGDLTEIVKEFSDIADVCLQRVYEICENDFIKRYGEPFYYTSDGEKRKSEFTILSLGKLGGRELNFSSDIDILYLYSSDKGETQRTKKNSNEYDTGIKLHQYYMKLSQMITNVIGEITEDSIMFRVDLRLRPEGKKGDIAYSLRSYEIYYESWGETWERQALLKARVSAGSQSLGNKFLKLIHPFIYRKYLDFTSIEEIRKVKERIDATLLIRGKDIENIKLGHGGIREIEFFVQSFQLIFGGRYELLQETNTLNVLKNLLILKFINENDYKKVSEAYIFLRELENRIQLSYGIQKHIIPEDANERKALARKMGMSDYNKERSVNRLIEIYNYHIKNVRERYDSLFYKEKEERTPYFIISSEDKEEAIEYLQDFNISDAEKAILTIINLREGELFIHPSEKSKILFDKLLPKLLKEISVLPEPDLALSNFEMFVKSSGSRENLYSFMLENDKVRELLFTLFGMSKFLSDILIRHPESFDSILNPDEWLVSKSKKQLYEQLLKSISKIIIFDKKLDEMRRFKKIEELKIGLRDFSLNVDLMDAFRDLSNLADVYLECALNISKDKLSKKYGIPEIERNPKKIECPITIIGLGKLGGQELDFGSDLDLIFVYEDDGTTSGIIDENSLKKNVIPNHIYFQKLYENIYNVVSSLTEAGYAYKIDLRLRPEGKKGATVLSMKRFEEYFNTRAETWERLALIRSRIVAGNVELGNKFIDITQKFVYANKLVIENILEINHIRERIEKELAEENEHKKDFKHGYGGIVDIEFIAQTLQLKYGSEFKELRISNTVKALKSLEKRKILSTTDSENILDAYRFLRRIENRLRIIHDTSLHSFDVSASVTDTLAVRMGYKKGKRGGAGEILIKKYNKHTGKIRNIFKKVFDKLLSEK